MFTENDLKNLNHSELISKIQEIMHKNEQLTQKIQQTEDRTAKIVYFD